jgi:hypothetical protein
MKFIVRNEHAAFVLVSNLGYNADRAHDVIREAEVFRHYGLLSDETALKKLHALTDKGRIDALINGMNTAGLDKELPKYQLDALKKLCKELRVDFSQIKKEWPRRHEGRTQVEYEIHLTIMFEFQKKRSISSSGIVTRSYYAHLDPYEEFENEFSDQTEDEYVEVPPGRIVNSNLTIDKIYRIEGADGSVSRTRTEVVVQDAKSLIDPRRTKGVMTRPTARWFVDHEMTDYIDWGKGFKSITAEAAEELIFQCSNSLHIPFITTIDAAAAKVLAQWKWWLWLSGLKVLCRESAAELSRFKGERLLLNGLVSITPEVARHLAGVKSQLVFNGLKSISSEVAQALSEHKNELHLNGIRTIKAGELAPLMRCKGSIGLEGLTSLDHQCAKLIVDGSKSTGSRSRQVSKQEWRFPSIKRIDDSALTALMGLQGTLQLGIRKLSLAQARICSQFKGEKLILDIVSIDAKIADALSAYHGCLDLGNVTQIDDSVASILVQRTGELKMWGLENVTENTREMLKNVDSSRLNLLVDWADKLRVKHATEDDEEEDSNDWFFDEDDDDEL